MRRQAQRDLKGALELCERGRALARLLGRHEPALLERLGFPDRHGALLEKLIAAAGTLAGAEDTASLADSVLSRIRDLAPAQEVYADLVARSSAAEREWTQHGDRWWIPEDLSAPPSTETTASTASGFTRDDVARVLSDL